MTFPSVTRASRFGSLAVLAAVFSFAACAQSVCTASATALLVHQEGLAERVGEISLACTGGTTGAAVSGTLFVALNTNITNRLDANGVPQGITITVNTGSGATATGVVQLTGSTSLAISNLGYTVPAVPATPVSISISGIRSAVASLSNGALPNAVSATLVATSGLQLTGTSSLTVAFSTPGLQQTTLNNGVPCNGSPLPTSLDFASFAATSVSSTVRVTEASIASFVAKKTGDDTGVRILVSLSGYGNNARVFVPDAVVGNNGTSPTSAGVFGSTSAAGTYTPGANQLLLVRVNGADQNGAGGTVALSQPASVTSSTSMTEITVTGGTAYAVYEVIDSNPTAIESAQIPVFVSVGQVNCPTPVSPSLAAKLAPVSTVSIATATDPVPRFISTPVVPDCQGLSDCGASYLPGFTVDSAPITLTGNSLGGKQSAFVRVGNTGPGQLSFTTTIAYQSGANYLSVSPSSGVNNVTLQVIADPSALQPGTYKATVTVDAGAYGRTVIPVTFTVGQAGVSINNVGNAASFTYGSVAPGSYAVLYGANLAGSNVSVTFNGVRANVIYTSAGQINVIVPDALAGQAGARVLVTVDGVDSNPFTVALTPNAPGIFNPGITNVADGSVNSVDHPALKGSSISIYLTGLSTPAPLVTVNIGDQKGIVPSFAGPQPTFPALDQVNVAVPLSLTAGAASVPVQVCVSGTQPICSNTVNLYVR